MSSKMILDRERNSADLRGVLDSHAEKATAAFARLTTPDLDGDKGLPDLTEFQLLLGRRLERLRQELVQLDEAHLTEREEDQELRRRRDEAARELSQIFSALRLGIEGPCGSGSCQKLIGLEGPVPRDLIALRRLTRRALKRLRQDSFQAPETGLPGFSLDPTAWIPLLEGPLGRLEEALELLSHEKHQTTGQQVDKSDLVAEYDRAYLATARLLENFFRYIDKPGLADRVRPSRRNGTTEEEPLEPAAEEPLVSRPEADLPEGPEPLARPEPEPAVEPTV